MPILATRGASSSKAYGFSNISTLRLTISANQTDLNLRTYALTNGWNIGQRLEVITNSGVYLLASSSSTPALTVSGSFPSGVRLVNNGYIIGYGGTGGAGGSGQPQPGSAGGTGGTAISAASTLFIANNNTVAGGGGGGGGGGGVNAGDWYGGGGGGGGAPYAVGGGAGLGTGPGTGRASAGATASLTAGGAGGGSVVANGGYGGSWGTDGAAGSASSQRSGGAAGTAGNYVSGNSFVIWEIAGTRLGNVA